MSDLPRVQAGHLSLKDVPRSPGVYAWFHQVRRSMQVGRRAAEGCGQDCVPTSRKA